MKSVGEWGSSDSCNAFLITYVLIYRQFDKKKMLKEKIGKHIAY